MLMRVRFRFIEKDVGKTINRTLEGRSQSVGPGEGVKEKW